MKKILSLFLVAFIWPSLANASDAPKTPSAESVETQQQMLASDVRGFVWGLPRKIILENETASSFGIFEGKEIFQGTQYDAEAYITYIFKDNALARAVIEFKPRTTTPDMQFNDYLDIRDAYIEEYGDIEEENLRWRNTEYQSNPDLWGMAVLRGHLSIETIWETPRTTVRMVYKGQNFQGEHETEYISKTILLDEEQPQFVPQTIQ